MFETETETFGFMFEARPRLFKIGTPRLTETMCLMGHQRPGFILGL